MGYHNFRSFTKKTNMEERGQSKTSRKIFEIKLEEDWNFTIDKEGFNEFIQKSEKSGNNNQHVRKMENPKWKNVEVHSFEDLSETEFICV